MADTATATAENEAASRIYEVGYQIVPTVAEENVEKAVADIRAKIEAAGGSFIAEGAPALMRLAYEMEIHEGGKNAHYDRGYFGWIKFEAAPETAEDLSHALESDKNILRSIVFKTVREETRARLKAPTLREVKRSDTITPRVHKAEEAGPVSEEDLDKALTDLTTE